MKIYWFKIFYRGEKVIDITAPNDDIAYEIFSGMTFDEPINERLVEVNMGKAAYLFAGDIKEWWEFVKSGEEDELLAEL